VIKGAIKRGENPDAIEVIRAASFGMIGRRSPKPPLLVGESSSSPPTEKAA
jgi:hypothetical protein